MAEWYDGTWYAPVPSRVIRVGDLVQHREHGQVGLVRGILICRGRHFLEVAILGDHNSRTLFWYAENVDLIHGTLRITERL